MTAVYLKMMKYAQKTVLVLAVLIRCILADCQKNCISCTGRTTYSCTKCNSSFYLSQGYCYQCPDSCTACVNSHNCSLCQSGRYGEKCQHHCNRNCEECQKDNGICTRCTDGYYGQYCEHNCNLCVDEQCGLHSCTIGCIRGYYMNDTFGGCRKCSWKCSDCESYAKCNDCMEGHYLHKHDIVGTFICYKCSNNDCRENCDIEHCKICKLQRNSKVCKECYNGFSFNGSMCVANTNNCSRGCSSSCDRTGVCVGKCNDGWTGDKCKDPCLNQCLKCNKNNPRICQKCIDGWYKSDCSNRCPNHCKKGSASTCRLSDGYCLNECKNNFWGWFCNFSCSVGCASNRYNATLCNQLDGQCMNGCKEGLAGDKCDAVVTSRQSSEVFAQESKEIDKPDLKTTFMETDTIRSSSKTSKQDDRMNVVVIGSIAGGVAALLIVTSVFIVCFIKTRRKHHRTNIANRREEGEDVVAEAYVNSQPVISDKDECLYAQVNKMNKRNNFGKEEPNRAKSKSDFDFEVEDVIANALNVHDSDLEEIKEEHILSMESEVNIPTSDTYYNTASLLRSRIEVSKLSEYIKNKSDYKKEFERLPVGLTRACTEAFRPNNRVKNRFKGIYAYDATRVVLKSGNYINSNLIHAHEQYPAYIASLGPTKSTMSNFATFWEMIWQEKTDKIVMLTNLDEAKKMKCEQYWPMQGNESYYGDYKVRCMSEKVFSEFTMREFTVARENASREVTQYQYTAWPDKTVPDSVASLLEFRDKVEQKQSTTTGPMIVHCSAGIGRTGTYIALDILIKEGKDDHSVDIFGCVSSLRGQRVQLVQNLEQYVYLHHCVLYALSCAPEPCPISTITHFTSDERLSKQHKTFVSLQHMANRDKIMGAKNKTRKENRMGADTPDDKHRVRLALIEKDYINAVYVNGYQECNKFILAQTPLQGTLEDFASMLYQEGCSCVVCLDDENVMDKSIVQYLPSVNKVATFGQFQLICTNIDRKEDFISRKLKVSRIGVSLSEEVSVSHYQFKGWSSIDCVPRSIQSFLNLVTDVEKTYQSLNRQHPIVVHCSTGAERSALFCAVSILMEKVAVEKEVSVLNTVCQVCSRRRSAFQDIEHLRFCYSCVEQMSEVSDSSTYYNSRNM